MCCVVEDKGAEAPESPAPSFEVCGTVAPQVSNLSPVAIITVRTCKRCKVTHVLSHILSVFKTSRNDVARLDSSDFVNDSVATNGFEFPQKVGEIGRAHV